MLYLKINSGIIYANLPSSSCLPSGEGVQSKRLPDKLSKTASPTEERLLCSAESPPRSLRLRSRCSCEGVPVAAPAPPSSTAGVALPATATVPAPPTEDRRDTSSKYWKRRFIEADPQSVAKYNGKKGAYVFEQIVSLILSFFVLHGGPEPFGLHDVHPRRALRRHYCVVLVDDL